MKRLFIISRRFVLLIFISSFLVGSLLYGETRVGNPSAGRERIRYVVIPLANLTWGYDIYVREQIYIHQTTIPAIPGTYGFNSRKAASDIAKIVVRKIKRGEIPPSVTIDELKKLKVLKK